MLPKTYYIKTFGCQMNESDSERIASLLEKYGLEPAETVTSADLVIFNTCGVRQTAEDRVYGQVHNLRKENKKAVIVITGCLAHRKDVQRKLKDKVDLFIPINNIGKMFDFSPFEKVYPPYGQRGMRGILRNNIKKILPNPPLKKEGTNHYLKIRPKYLLDTYAFVPIMTGCNNFCSYCVVPYARGREWSRTPEDILEEISELTKNGYEEITLLGQNVNSYKHADKHLKLNTFPALLDYIAKNFPEIKFNFLTSHPKDFTDKLIEVIKKNKNISREIHLPVQSGSDKVLKDMNRPYTQKHYLELIEKIHKNIPNAKVSTDVIVGFPTETEEDFRETVKVFKKVKFFEAYINKYSPRPETAALKLGNPIPWDEKKRREKVLRKLVGN